MKIAVEHSTVYRFDCPARLGPHDIRLRPRDDGSLRLLDYSLSVEPQPVLLAECLDQDGNHTQRAWFGEPAASLEVRSRFTVETLRVNPFDFTIATGDLLRVPLRYGPRLGSVLMAYTVRQGSAGAVDEFARDAAAQAGWNTMAFLTGLAAEIYGSFRAVVRPEGEPLPAAETLDARAGSCRDYAVLFAEACRAMGLAARFVSGYEREAAGSDPAYMHAWAEVYLPGGGWRGFDPARGLAVSTSHVTVAAALDAEMAAPVAGAYSGARRPEMQTSIRMTVEE
jgi:transglutaminase-like putative cysteine protease